MSGAVRIGVPLDPLMEAKFTKDSSPGIRRLNRNLVSLIEAHPKACLLGRDPLAEQLAQESGFSDNDLAILRVGFDGVALTVVGVPDQIWGCPDQMARLFEIKRVVGLMRRRIVLLPATFFQRQPRLNNSRMLERASDISINRAARMVLFFHLVKHGHSSLHECACAISDAHEHPYGAVLQMAATGAIKIDLRQPIRPESPVYLPDLESKAS
jgi:hypothetical protein